MRRKLFIVAFGTIISMFFATVLIGIFGQVPTPIKTIKFSMGCANELEIKIQSFKDTIGISEVNIALLGAKDVNSIEKENKKISKMGSKINISRIVRGSYEFSRGNVSP